MKPGLSALRRFWPAAPVALLGVAIGVIGWGGFNTAMEATNSLGFCVSCHEMRDNVYEEYKKTVHYRNKSGVRAICSDCHVPHDWTHKVIRKVQATKELYHWALGSIDTREKFEAKRHELARHEWDRMRANDSRECRNCHSYDAMDFHKQDAKAASAMTAAMKAGKTCIDCHKGIAHTFPDITAGHRADGARLAEAAKKLTPAVGATLYAIGPAPLYLEKPGAGDADGEIAPATAIKVVDVDGDLLQVEVAGWHREELPSTFYQRLGKRIPAAKLSEAAAEKVEAIETVDDPDTEQPWVRARIVGWTRAGHFSAKIEPLWSLGARINDDNCSICHATRLPESAKANEWIGHLNAMKRFTRLQADEVALLQSYLQNHAKDVGPADKTPK
jgi:trimethylamine-N-oxide reductase cytochrome c-type subunit TorC